MIREELCFCLDEVSLAAWSKHRILRLSIIGQPANNDRCVFKMRANLLHYLFKIFTHVQHLKFYQYSPHAYTSTHFSDQPSIFSSHLVELHINMYCFKDFLYLLDGRFDHLRTLVVQVFNMWHFQPIEINTVSENNRKESSIYLCLSISRTQSSV